MVLIVYLLVIIKKQQNMHGTCIEILKFCVCDIILFIHYDVMWLQSNFWLAIIRMWNWENCRLKLSSFLPCAVIAISLTQNRLCIHEAISVCFSYWMQAVFRCNCASSTLFITIVRKLSWGLLVLETEKKMLFMVSNFFNFFHVFWMHFTY
jgi:hypothetical protein